MWFGVTPKMDTQKPSAGSQNPIKLYEHSKLAIPEP